MPRIGAIDARLTDLRLKSIQPGRLRQTLKAAEAAGAAFTFIDTPGKSNSAALEAARVADLVFIPVRPQIFDLETLAAVRDALRLAGSPPALWYSMACTRPHAVAPTNSAN